MNIFIYLLMFVGGIITTIFWIKLFEAPTDRVISLTPVETLSLLVTFVSVGMAIWQHQLAKLERAKVNDPVFFALAGVFNELGQKLVYINRVWQVAASPTFPSWHSTWTMRMAYGQFIEETQAFVLGLRENVGAAMRSLKPDDPEGDSVPRASDYGLSSEMRAWNKKFQKQQMDQSLKGGKTPPQGPPEPQPDSDSDDTPDSESPDTESPS